MPKKKLSKKTLISEESPEERGYITTWDSDLKCDVISAKKGSEAEARLKAFGDFIWKFIEDKFRE